MRLTTKHRFAVGGAKLAGALVLVSSAVGAAAAPVPHAKAKTPAVRAHAGVSLRGTIGVSVLHGSARNDWIQGGAGADTLIGGAGNDAIDAVDGARDVVRCDAGFDQVTADRADAVATDCEAVIRRES